MVIFIALRSVYAMVEVGLFVVGNVEDVQVVVFKTVLTGAFEASLSGNRETESFNKHGWGKLDLANTGLFTAALHELPVIDSPSIILTDVSV